SRPGSSGKGGFPPPPCRKGFSAPRRERPVPMRSGRFPESKRRFPSTRVESGTWTILLKAGLLNPFDAPVDFSLLFEFNWKNSNKITLLRRGEGVKGGFAPWNFQDFSSCSAGRVVSRRERLLSKSETPTM